MSPFDKIVDRSATHSMKWEDPRDKYPFWVADMELETAPAVKEAIKKRAAHGIYGYTTLPKEFFDSYRHWFRSRHNLELQPEAMVFASGAVPAISSMVRKLSTPAEKVLLLSPVYNIFYNSIVNNGRFVLESELKEKEGEYEIDWKDLEDKLSDPQTNLMILCNPHNPIGKIWKKEELERILTLAEKYGVTIISDEVHGDLVDPGLAYTPLASLEKGGNHVSIYSPGKSFNLAGLQSAMVYCENPFLFHKIWRGLNTDEAAEPNAFVIDATIAAYQSAGWLDELKDYLYGNKKVLEEFITKELPKVRLLPSQATYLSWLDVSEIGPADALADFLQEHYGVHLSVGEEFGTGGKNFLRLNRACPRPMLQKGLEAMKEGIEAFQKQTF